LSLPIFIRHIAIPFSGKFRSRVRGSLIFFRNATDDPISTKGAGRWSTARAAR
jgi:hypothetical protein